MYIFIALKYKNISNFAHIISGGTLVFINQKKMTKNFW